MTKLEQTIKELFPAEYAADTWRGLLPRYLSIQDKIYAGEVARFAETVTSQGGRIEDQTVETGYPVSSVEYGEACEELARMEGFCYRGLAIVVDHLRKRLSDETKRADTYQQLSKEFDESSMDLVSAYKQLKEERDALFHENQALKDFNNRSIN